MNKDKKTFLPSNIRYLRQVKGITQNDIAEYCDKSAVAVSYWENGSREPNAVDLGRLSEIFEIPVDTLLLKDLRIKDNSYDEIEVLFSKNKEILTDEDKETIKFLIEKRKREIDKQNENQ